MTSNSNSLDLREVKREWLDSLRQESSISKVNERILSFLHKKETRNWVVYFTSDLQNNLRWSAAEVKAGWVFYRGGQQYVMGIFS